MVGGSFSAHWLRGRPIDGLHKAEMVDWSSQMDGYYCEKTESYHSNSVLRFFRCHAKILFDDDFKATDTIKHDDSQIIGRIHRVFRAIDMMRKYHAACQDGADLSCSIVRDFDTIWHDAEGRILPHELMLNLLRVEEEIRTRTPENSPVRAFWREQNIHRSKRTTQPQLIEADASAESTPDFSSRTYCSYELENLAPSIEGGCTEPPLGLAVHYFQSQEQASHGTLGHQASSTKLGTQDSEQFLALLDPTVAAFVPSELPESPPSVIPETSILKSSPLGPSDYYDQPEGSLVQKFASQTSAVDLTMLDLKDPYEIPTPLHHGNSPAFPVPFKPGCLIPQTSAVSGSVSVPEEALTNAGPSHGAANIQYRFSAPPLTPESEDSTTLGTPFRCDNGYEYWGHESKIYSWGSDCADDSGSFRTDADNNDDLWGSGSDADDEGSSIGDDLTDVDSHYSRRNMRCGLLRPNLELHLERLEIMEGYTAFEKFAHSQVAILIWSAATKCGWNFEDRMRQH